MYVHSPVSEQNIVLCVLLSSFLKAGNSPCPEKAVHWKSRAVGTERLELRIALFSKYFVHFDAVTLGVSRELVQVLRIAHRC
jgi:hypothetical protein